MAGNPNVTHHLVAQADLQEKSVSPLGGDLGGDAVDAVDGMDIDTDGIGDTGAMLEKCMGSICSLRQAIQFVPFAASGYITKIADILDKMLCYKPLHLQINDMNQIARSFDLFFFMLLPKTFEDYEWSYYDIDADVAKVGFEISKEQASRDHFVLDDEDMPAFVCQLGIRDLTEIDTFMLGIRGVFNAWVPCEMDKDNWLQNKLEAISNNYKLFNSFFYGRIVVKNNYHLNQISSTNNKNRAERKDVASAENKVKKPNAQANVLLRNENKVFSATGNIIYPFHCPRPDLFMCSILPRNSFSSLLLLLLLRIQPR